MVPVSPCWMLPAETQPRRSTEFPLPMPARGGWILLTRPGSTLQVAIREGAVAHEPPCRTVFHSCISLFAAIARLLLLPCPIRHRCRGLCWLFPSQFIKKEICFAVEAIQGMAEAVRSEIWHSGEWGPICGSCQRGCSQELGSGPGCEHRAGRNRKKHPGKLFT